MKKGKYNLLLDGSWGSSAKGAATTRLVDRYQVENAASCNYPNAGHTAIIDDLKFVCKALPTAAILNRFGKKVTSWVGPGSGFTIDQIKKEIEECGLVPGKDLFIHDRAMIVTDAHKEAEAPEGTLSTEHISSTMSGAGAAQAAKLMRGEDVKLARDFEELKTVLPLDFAFSIREKLGQGETFLHEVSQGFALSIDYGTHYPHCTSRETSMQQAFAYMGLLPDMIGDVYLNVRALPIRVGNNFRDGKQTGYSGDWMPDQEELTWEQVAIDAEMPEEMKTRLSELECTTVTGKIRRCATQSWDLLEKSAKFSGATKLILNFPQYIHWSAFKAKGGRTELNNLHPKIKEYVAKMEQVTGVPVVMVGTGPDHRDAIWLD